MDKLYRFKVKSCVSCEHVWDAMWKYCTSGLELGYLHNTSRTENKLTNNTTVAAEPPGKSDLIIHNPPNLCYLKRRISFWLTHLIFIWVSITNILSALRSSASNSFYATQARQAQNDRRGSFPELGVKAGIWVRSLFQGRVRSLVTRWHTAGSSEASLCVLVNMAPHGNQAKDGGPLLGLSRPESLGQINS